MPLRIFRSRPVAAANAIQILSVAGMFGMFFLGALYLRRVLGYDALEIGLAFLPVTIAMGTLSIRYSERIFMALGARRALLAGLTLVLAGLVVFALAPVHADYATQVAPSMLLLGLGAGTAFPALMNLAMSGATQQDAGLASGLVNTTAQVGGALGLAVLATLSTSRTNALTASGHPIASALTSGYHLAFWVAAALVGCALASSSRSSTEAPRARARRNTRRKPAGQPQAEARHARRRDSGSRRRLSARRGARGRSVRVTLTCRDGAQDEARQRALAGRARRARSAVAALSAVLALGPAVARAGISSDADPAEPVRRGSGARVRCGSRAGAHSVSAPAGGSNPFMAPDGRSRPARRRVHDEHVQ